jgi:MFS family permease
LADVSPKSPTLVVLLLLYAAFVSLGLPDGILGAAWPAMRAGFGAPLNGNWPLLTLATCGGTLSSFLSGLLLRRLGVRRVLLFTTFLTGSVILGYAASPTLAVLTGLAFFLGLGNGAIDAGLNHFAANHLSTRHMNWLHASWGVGMSLGSLMISGVLAAQGSWRFAYLIVGLLQLSLGVAFLLGFPALLSLGTAPEAKGPAAHPGFSSTFALPAAWASMASFFTYCGLECATGLWIASALHDGRQWSMQASSLMATVYWGSLTIGRFLIGTISQRTTPIRLIRGSLVFAIAGTSLVALSSALTSRPTVAGLMTATGLLITGFGLSPIFPMLMHDTPRCVGKGHALNLIGFQAAVGNLGYTLIPIAVGTLMGLYSTEWLGPMLFGLAIALLALVAVRERYAVAEVTH